MTDVSELKVALRQRVLARRKQLRRAESEVLVSASAQLVAQVLADARWRAARGVAAFVGVRGEPDTWALLEQTLSAGKRLWLPRVDGPRMVFWELREPADLEALERRKMGLREPAERGRSSPAPGPAEGVDLILVPGLAFSPRGLRLGFGAGHYDRAFGSRWPAARWAEAGREGTRAVAMGTCLDEFIVDDLPEEAHDLPMDALVSEAGVRRCPR